MAFFQLYLLITPQLELLSTKQQSSSSLMFLFFDIILCKLIFDRLRTFPKIISRFSFFLRSQLLRLGGGGAELLPSPEDEEAELQSTTTDLVISREDVETVMRKLGFVCNPDQSQNHDQSMGNSGQILELFDEEEPSLGEVKEAFDVFDENRDGFIDEAELQRVMVRLGFKEGFQIDGCRKMIRAFDQNGDGRIDFSEFFKFMEISFC
ncbi:Probable calcium-binding protein CML46 [Linum grandiflorum]